MTNFKCGVLDAWVQGLPASGRYTFTRQEAMQATGLTHGAFRLVSMRLSSQRVIVRLHQNLYAVIPLEYRAVGVLPAEWVVDDLLVHIGQKYYLGLLTAAALHGAAHQRPRVCQVVTDRPVRPVEVHGMGIRFMSVTAWRKLTQFKSRVKSGICRSPRRRRRHSIWSDTLVNWVGYPRWLPCCRSWGKS